MLVGNFPDQQVMDMVDTVSNWEVVASKRYGYYNSAHEIFVLYGENVYIVQYNSVSDYYDVVEL